MFKLYNTYILPKLLDRGMRPIACNGTRSDVVKNAHGVVLEIGFGSGYNLPFYTQVSKLYALEPSREMYDIAKERIASADFPIEYLKNSAEHIPLENHSIDTVVSTWSLCSIPNLPQALNEVRRVLKPGGRFLFVEHGQSPKRINSLFQKLVTPIHSQFMGNCHLDRKIDDFIRDAGLSIEHIEMSHEEGRPLMFSYQGTATNKKSGPEDSAPLS